MMSVSPLPLQSFYAGPPRSVTFNRLYAAQREPGSETPGSEHSEDQPRGGTDAPPLVLIVDDDRGIRDSLAMVLANEGLECMTARNGFEALERLRRADRQPALILLDLMMPVMNGKAFRAAQLADPKLATVPTLILSAATDASAQAQTLAVADSLRKPIDLDVLLETVARLIPDWQPAD